MQLDSAERMLRSASCSERDMPGSAIDVSCSYVVIVNTWCMKLLKLDGLLLRKVHHPVNRLVLYQQRQKQNLQWATCFNAST